MEVGTGVPLRYVNQSCTIIVNKLDIEFRLITVSLSEVKCNRLPLLRVTHVSRQAMVIYSLLGLLVL